MAVERDYGMLRLVAIDCARRPTPRYTDLVPLDAPHNDFVFAGR